MAISQEPMTSSVLNLTSEMKGEKKMKIKREERRKKESEKFYEDKRKRQ